MVTGKHESPHRPRALAYLRNGHVQLVEVSDGAPGSARSGRVVDAVVRGFNGDHVVTFTEGEGWWCQAEPDNPDPEPDRCPHALAVELVTHASAGGLPPRPPVTTHGTAGTR